MKKIFHIILFLSCAVVLLVAQPPTVTLKVKEKSGFLGMGGPQFIEVRLTNQQGEKTLTDVSVNAGTMYFFVTRPTGGWLFDTDFVDEDLVNLTLVQGEQVFPVVWKGPFEEGDTTLQIGFVKQVKINLPLLFKYQMGDASSEAEMKIPMELWPGHSVFTRLTSLVADHIANTRYRAAIPACEQILRESSFSIFPTYDQFREVRTRSFRTYYIERWNEISAIVDDPQTDLKTKLAKLDESRPLIRFVADSILAPDIGFTETDSAVAEILSRARETLTWIDQTRVALQNALDEKNVRWIFEGSVAGRGGFRYQTILEALAYAFASVDFADTAATRLSFTLSPEIQASLEKNLLVDSYETFLRLTNDRHEKGLSLFSEEFLNNVQRDTGSFRLPYYSALRAVNSYFDMAFESARMEIFRIFRVSYDADLSARFDYMRIMISIRKGEFSREALHLMREAAALEATDTEAAGQKYLQASLVAPDFAYASFELGKFYARTGDQIRAQTFFQRAYDLDTLYLSAYRESFNLYRRTGNYKPMIEVLTRAIQKGNNYWETQSNLGLAYMGDGDPARAIQHYERALAINPQSYTTNIQLGLAHQTVKNYQKAREFFNNAINIDPLRQEAVEFLTRLNELQRMGK